MSIKFRTWFKAVSLLTATAVIALGAGLGPPAPDNRSDDALVNQLAADKPIDRVDAQRLLAGRGKSAIPRLKMALDDPRPEVRNRAAWCLRYIRFTGRKDLDAAYPEAMSLARAYLNTPTDAGRRNLLVQLVQIQPPPRAVLLGLYTLESDAGLRVPLLVSITGDPFDREVTRMVAEGDTGAVEELLDTIVATDPTAVGSDYAMFMRFTGRLDEAIARWKAQYENADDPRNRRCALDTLAFLYRAAGRNEDAITKAREAGDPRLILAIMASQSDFKDFEYSTAMSQIYTPVVQAGLKAGCERMLGRPDTLATFMARAGPIASDDERSFVPSRCYLLNDAPVQGIAMLGQARPEMVIEMLSRRGEYTAALVAANGAVAANPRSSDAKAQLAILRQTLGLDPPFVPQPTPDIRPVAPPVTQPVLPDQPAIDQLRQKHYTQAAELFEALAARYPERVDLLYLQGYAMAAGGDRKAGLALMKRSELAPLGNPARRWAFGYYLGLAGLEQEKNQQFDLALQSSGTFSAMGCADIYASRAEAAEKAGLWGEAADALDRLVLINLTPDLLWQSDQYLLVPARAHMAHARDYWQRGMKKQALAEYDRYEKYLPVEVTATIDLVTRLDTAGDHDEADRRFDRIWNLLSASAVKYPKSQLINNNLAWLAACCNRKLDEALPYAEAARRLDPTTSAMDTMAELKFRRGERGEAIELSKKILAGTPDSDPGRDYARRQADRFAHAAIPSTTQPVEEPK